MVEIWLNVSRFMSCFDSLSEVENGVVVSCLNIKPLTKCISITFSV